MKKILALTMALCMIFAMCAVSASADEPITLTYAEVNPLEGTIVGAMAKAFKEKVEELSGGAVLIDIQASGVLGSEDQILDNLLFFKNEVKGLDDLKGLKIRVSSDPVMTGMVSNLGASATSVPFTELYSALNTGVVDGAEQPTANYFSNAFQEVAPYLLLDGHTLGALQIVITDNAWAKLNEEQQGWIMEAAKYASSVCREKVAEIEGETFDKLAAAGATVIPVEDKGPWVEACQPTIKANTEKLADVYQQLLDMAG